MRTMSMARTTPAQNPRGLSKSKVFWLSDNGCSFNLDTLKDTLFPQRDCLKATEKCHSRQRKCKNCMELAARGEKEGLNGERIQSCLNSSQDCDASIRQAGHEEHHQQPARRDQGCN